MTNEIQKQYERLEDVPSIMLRMKDVYAVPDRHIRYVATKAFFGTKMTEGSSVHSHGVKMLSLVEKLEDLKVGLNNDTYIDVILQSLTPSYDPFIVNCNMNGHEKSIHELINMLVQYEATTHKSEPAVLVGEASTSKAKGKGARRWRGRRAKGTTVTTTTSTGGALLLLEGKGKGKVWDSQRSKANDVCMYCQGKGHWKREYPQLLSNPGAGRNRRLSKDEMILRLGDGKVVATEAVGSLRLVMSVGPLSILARGGFSYFITFTDDHSRYGYVYLMSTSLRPLKENGILSQWTPPGTHNSMEWLKRNRTFLDMVRSMMSFTELPPSFWGYALETAAKLVNIAPSKSVPRMPYEIWHGKPASYKYLRVWGSPAYVKRLVGDKLDSRSSLCRFIGYPKETAGYYFYDPAEKKFFVSRNAVFLEKDFPSDNRRDEVLIEESSGEPHHDSTTSFEPTVHTDGVPVLRRSLENLEYLRGHKIRNGLDGFKRSLDPGRPTQGRKAVGCKWVYKRKLGADGEVTAFKARLVAEGYTQRPGVDFEETYSPVAMAKSIRILLAKQHDIRHAPGRRTWAWIKSILQYLKRTKDMFLIYGGRELILKVYSDANFQSDDDDAKSNRVLCSSLMVVWSLGRVPSRIPHGFHHES
ncbi:UNVERIFIED_CONTAM: Retrovirus-related Pol polyprotein from transposon RE2 [Sesamum latifolium]|uniref:Retrovirus-related Pol polyprotein from transposon RE2 n=1 Tax=Sesamum latifolium TaxID=2727402 RepID=A0AAW2WI14_9LAMI